MTQQLEEHIAIQQERAIFLASVVRLLDACHGFEDRDDLALCLSSAAVGAADRLADALDSVNLPMGDRA